MRSNLAVLLLATISLFSAATAAERYPNALHNNGFEAGLDGWDVVQVPGAAVIDAGSAHSGRQSVRVTGAPKSASWVHQTVVFQEPMKRAVHVSGWSKTRGVQGEGMLFVALILIDGHYADGSAIPRQFVRFASGTHDWQAADVTIPAPKPIKSLEIAPLVAEAKGTVWFDDIEVKPAPFDFRDVRVIPSVFGGSSVSVTGGLSLPAPWKAELIGPHGVIARASGEGTLVAFSWVNETRTLPPGAYSVLLTATERLLDEIASFTQVVRLQPGASRDYAVWIENSMKRVLPQALPSAISREARVSLAGNEYESFEICLLAAPGREIKDVSVRTSDLVSGDGHRLPASAIEWQQVGFVKVNQLRASPANEGAQTGWWPDPLLPVDKFDLKPGFTQSVWITIHAGPQAKPGDYVGTLSVVAAGQSPFAIQVRVHVYGFSLPVEGHLKTAFALMNGFLERVYGAPLTSQIRQQYGDFMLRHRLNPDDISRTDLPEIEDLLRFDKRGMNAFNVANLVPQRGNRTWVPNAELDEYTPVFKRELIARLDPYMARLRETGLIRKAYVYAFDERDPEFFPVMREYFGLIKERYPEVRTVTTSHIQLDPQVLRDLHVDAIVPLTQSYSLDDAEKCRKENIAVWSYVALGPREPYANFLADDPLVEARVLWWQAYQQKIDGFLYWGVNIWQRLNNERPIDPARGPLLDWSITTGKPGDEEYQDLHGDGVLIYPGIHGPIGSIRLANIRDGLEDYEYLWMLARKLGIEPARQQCLPVTSSLTSFTQDPNVIYRQRDKIAQRISMR